MSYKTINLEIGMPTVLVAKSRLNQELRMAKTAGYKAVKIIHGYGSSGKGGAIKTEVIRTLRQKKQSGEIKEFAAGENFSPFDADARRIISLYAPLAKDKDFARTNHGITIVLL